MIASASKHGVPLWVGYYRRALPRFLKIQQLLLEGAIGDVRFVTSRQYAPLTRPDSANGAMAWRLDPLLSGGGLFFEGACHTLDILDFLLGPIVEVRGFTIKAGHIVRRTL